MKTILLIDDDPSIFRILKEHIAETGGELIYSDSGTRGLEQAKHRSPDLVLLDITMPDVNGYDVCKELRAMFPRMPILLLSSRSLEIDKVLGLELGADDYIVKPFSLAELLARIRAHLRRSSVLKHPRDEPSIMQIEFEGLTIDPLKRLVRLNGFPVTFTTKEFDVLAFLARNPGTPFTREELLERLWGMTSPGYVDNVTALIRRIRKKIQIDPATPEYVETVHGYGYRFVSPSSL